ncbi:uncharacterized protein LOC143246408 isoform X2 [Tachypleus tridentatus]|uniref:uncharacterized protein LOC143246408 isoform X2 n=1 Tax=Tachypleus tridentatus TaxID=6853 RepID=UPI003FCFD13C
MSAQHQVQKPDGGDSGSEYIKLKVVGQDHGFFFCGLLSSACGHSLNFSMTVTWIAMKFTSELR